MNLRERFSSVTRTSIVQLKIDLQNIKKGPESVDVYLQRIKESRLSFPFCCLYMVIGTRSKNQVIIPYDPEPERNARKLAREKYLAQDSNLGDTFLKDLFRDPESSTSIFQPLAPVAHMALALPAAGQPLRNSLAARINAVPRCIIYPDVEDGTTFEIKPHILNILPSFHGLPNSDPNMHLADFIEACDNTIIRGFSSEAIKLRLFPFSLKDKAKAWLHSLSANSITTWTELQEKFLNKFFPSFKTLALKKEILALLKSQTSLSMKLGNVAKMEKNFNAKFAALMQVSSMPNAQEACIICSETTHDITQCPNKDSYPELVQEHVNMNLTALVGNLETQVGQLATMFNEREKGKFPSQSEQNPRGMEHCKVIRTLRNGKSYDNREVVHHEAEVEEEELTESAPLATKS
ncbi:unnamed protein product [Malus baccata var. baccata]